MLSFHNDPKIKQFYLERVRAHAVADEIWQGKYWENGKGCAVGCTVHGAEHKRYESELGLPEWLAHLEDVLFEWLTNAEAKAFPLAFLDAIPVGVSLDRVRWQFCAFVLRECHDRVVSLDCSAALKNLVVNAIQGTLHVLNQAIGTGQWDTAAASDAAMAARAAANAAASATETDDDPGTAAAAYAASAAAYIADVTSAVAAGFAHAAASAVARAVARAVASDAASAAASAAAHAAAYKRYADYLLRLLREQGEADTL